MPQNIQRTEQGKVVAVVVAADYENLREGDESHTFVAWACGGTFKTFICCTATCPPCDNTMPVTPRVICSVLPTVLLPPHLKFRLNDRMGAVAGSDRVLLVTIS